MELSKKTTILFSPDLHEQLARLARARGVSIGWLVREAVRSRYGLSSLEDRLAASDEIAALALPVGSPAEMKAESVAAPDDLLP